MNEREYHLTNGFSLFYDSNKVVPILDGLKPTIGAKITQFIWNKAYEHSLTDFKSCGNGEYHFFIIKNPSLKVSYRDFKTFWIVYSIVPYSDNTPS